MNSLFKVLFNFPSRYLSAIGLATVFSLRWSLPPALGCIPKQPDSGKTRSDRGKRPYGPDTRRGTRPRSEGHRRSPTIAQGLPYVTTRRAPRARRFDAGLFPIHSPLLRESRLVSFPPLNNMLKFSGCSRLNSGRALNSRRRPGETPTPRGRRRRPARPHARRPNRSRRRSSSLHRTDQPALGTWACGRPRRKFGRAQLGETAEKPTLKRGRRAETRRPAILRATLRQTRSRDWPETAIRVQKVDVQCVLQFTLLLALSCVLHRLASRVIHRRESYVDLSPIKSNSSAIGKATQSTRPERPPEGRRHIERGATIAVALRTVQLTELRVPPEGDAARRERREPTNEQPDVRADAGALHDNDPSAGSPTETLLRLLLPLNDQVWSTFRHPSRQ